MFYQNKNIFGIILLSATLLFSSISCDSLLPDEFDQDKIYSTPEIDDRACSLFFDSLGYFINSKTIASLVDSATQANFTENQIIVSRFNELADSMEILIRESLLVVNYFSNQPLSYAVLRVAPGETKDIYLYMSFVFNQNNISENVDIQLIRNDSSLVTFNDDLLTETVSGCSQLVGSRIVPTIKIRKKIHLEEGVYFVRFNVSNPTLVGPFKLVILSI